LAGKGNLSKALPLAEEAFRLANEYGHSQPAGMFGNILAEIYVRFGEPDKAVKLLKEQEYTYRTSGDLEDLSRYLACYAKALTDLGHAKEALPMAEEAYELATNGSYAVRAKETKVVLDEIRSQLE
jgi:tetratricopeptide (TPR) repeat protein